MSEQELEVTETELDKSQDAAVEAAEESEAVSAAPESDVTDEAVADGSRSGRRRRGRADADAEATPTLMRLTPTRWQPARPTRRAEADVDRRRRVQGQAAPPGG